MKKSRYDTLGASASKAAVHEAIGKAGMEAADSSLFASVSTDLAADEQYASFLHCDGAGTKTIVPYLLYREGAKAQVFAGLAQDAFVMNLDDILCLGIPDSLLVGNAIARNRKLIPDEVLPEIIGAYQQLVATAKSWGLNIELAGGETADCGDTVRTLVVDAVVAGRIKKPGLIDTARIKPGDAIVGLSSTGKASYEETANSGIGSNGLTLARHAILANKYAKKYPEIVDPMLGSEDAYTGSFSLEDNPAGLEMSIGEALASPTRSYAPILLEVYRELAESLHGAIHVTGGALTKVLRFGPGGLHFIKDELFPTPAIFSLIQQSADVSWEEMYQVFNMGHRFELYIDDSLVERVVEIASQFNVEAKRIGHVKPAQDSNKANNNQVTVKSEHGLFRYEL